MCTKTSILHTIIPLYILTIAHLPNLLELRQETLAGVDILIPTWRPILTLKASIIGMVQEIAIGVEAERLGELRRESARARRREKLRELINRTSDFIKNPNRLC